MRHRSLLSLVLLAVAPLVAAPIAGCESKANDDDGGTTTSTGTGPSTTSSGTGAGGTGGGGAGGADPYTIVPPQHFDADPEVECPEAFKTAKPVSGENTGYEIAGQSRDFYLILPDASFTGPRPLFVGFDGTLETGEEFATRAKLEEFAAKGFVVVSPSNAGNGTIWPVWDSMHAPSEDDSANKDLALFDSLVKCVAGHFDIDQKRLYVGGHSAGGIMSNYVLQRRSDLLAGGIVASGVFSLTSPPEPAPLSEMFVVVTWGGDHDEYHGGTSQVNVPAINFVEQASIASQFYDAEPEVTQSACTEPVGHAWLDSLNGWFIDALLAHPKSLGVEGVTPALPADATATCTSTPFVFTGGLQVDCPTTSAVPNCDDACQFYADCAVENATVGGIMGPQLQALGFSGDDNSDCTGCVSHCDAAATSAVDTAVLQCMKDARDSSICGPGIDGALPVIDAINGCCEDHSDSPYCMDFCNSMSTNPAVMNFLPTCQALLAL